MVNVKDQSLSADLSTLGSFAEPASPPRVFSILLAHKRLILTAALTGAALFALYVCIATPTFTAEALVVTNQPEFGQEVSPLATSRETQVAALLSEIDLIKSPAFVMRIATEFDLTNDPEFRPPPGWLSGSGDASATVSRPDVATSIGTLRTHISGFAGQAIVTVQSWLRDAVASLGISRTPATEPVDAQMAKTIRSINRHLTVSTDTHSVTITIRFWSADPYKASRLATAFANTYVKEKLEAKQEQSEQINTWLNGQLGVLRSRVVAADRAVQEARQRLDISEVGTAGTLSDQTLLQWNHQLVSAQTSRLQAEARLATAEKVLTEQSPTRSISDVLNSPLIQRLREQKGTLTAQYAAAVSKSGAGYPLAVALKKQIDDLSETLKTETRKILDSLANEVETTTRSEAVITTALSLAAKHASASQLELTTVRELEQRAASERILYDQFLRKFNETLGNNYLPQTDVRVISPASPPDRPSYPRMIFFLPTGFLLGMFLGVVKALHSVGSDRTFKATVAVEAATGLPTLGHIPLRRALNSGSRAAIAAERYFEQSVSRVLTILEQASRGGKPPKIVAVTSALPREGKSTFCAALARSAAGLGKRVLVIEFDRHFPSLSTIFRNAANTGDIMDLIAGTKTLSQIVQRDIATSVDFVPIAIRTENARQIVSSVRLQVAFDHLRDTYDLILIDTAPILANADIAALCSVIDTCLFVIRWGTTPREAVASALRQSRLLNVPTTGIVMTCVNHSQADSDAEGKFYNQIIRYHDYKGSV